eukprot:m.344328 g.344328  ORF g.344328 m.344328 type:complete len:137 (-) comp24182_c0_seq1:158-568(-)
MLYHLAHINILKDRQKIILLVFRISKKITKTHTLRGPQRMPGTAEQLRHILSLLYFSIGVYFVMDSMNYLRISPKLLPERVCEVIVGSLLVIVFFFRLGQHIVFEAWQEDFQSDTDSDSQELLQPNEIEIYEEDND